MKATPKERILSGQFSDPKEADHVLPWLQGVTGGREAQLPSGLQSRLPKTFMAGGGGSICSSTGDWAAGIS